MEACREVERNRKRNYSAQQAVARAVSELIVVLGLFFMNVAKKESFIDEAERVMQWIGGYSL